MCSRRLIRLTNRNSMTRLALSSSYSYIEWLKESLIQQELFTPNLIDHKQQPVLRFIQYLFSIILRNNSFYESIVRPQPPTIKFCAEKTLTFQLLKLMQEVNGEHNLGVSLNANRLLEILYNFNFESRNEQQVCFLNSPHGSIQNRNCLPKFLTARTHTNCSTS